MEVYIVDGTFELFRAYYGSPSAKDSSGRVIGAVRGCVGSIASLLSEFATKDGIRIGCAFDTEITSFRNEMFPGYKTGEDIEPELLAQFPLIEEAIEAMGVKVWRMIEFEADDALATAAHLYSKDPNVNRVIICSPDKDMYQCVGDKVISWDRMRSKFYDPDAVIEKLGVHPESIPDYLALVGDSADGIPGLQGWGAKSSSTILRHYKQIESIPASYADVPEGLKIRGGVKLFSCLQENFDDAILYRSLATLRTDVPLQTNLEDLRWQGPNQNWEEVRKKFNIKTVLT